MTELHSHGHGTRSLDRDIQINRLCKPANPAFTISKMTNMRGHFGVLTHVRNTDIPSRTLACLGGLPLALRAKPGGADRDRTDDLKLAKLALSQLSYGPREKRSVDRRSAAQGLPSRSCGSEARLRPKRLRRGSLRCVAAQAGGPGTS